MIDAYPARFQLALTASDVDAAFQAGKIASLLGAEGGHSIGGSLGVLRVAVLARRPLHDAHPQLQRRLGRLGHRRRSTPAACPTSAAGRGRDEPPRHAGRPVARLGRHDARRPRRVRRPGDLLPLRAPARSATTPATCPTTCCGGCRSTAACAWSPSCRSSSRRSAPTGSPACGPRPPAAAPTRPSCTRSSPCCPMGKDHPMPPATLAQVADHIDHVRAVAGIDHVGIGGDFDGTPVASAGLHDVSRLPGPVRRTGQRRRWSESDLQGPGRRQRAPASSATRSRSPMPGGFADVAGSHRDCAGVGTLARR